MALDRPQRARSRLEREQSSKPAIHPSRPFARLEAFDPSQSLDRAAPNSDSGYSAVTMVGDAPTHDTWRHGSQSEAVIGPRPRFCAAAARPPSWGLVSTPDRLRNLGKEER